MNPRTTTTMTTIIRLLVSCGWLILCCASHAADTPTAMARYPEGPVTAADIQQQSKLLTSRLIAEFLEYGKLSRESVQAYQLLNGLAERNGVRLEKIPLRTTDERTLGPALIVSRLENLGLGYDRVYKLRLQNPGIAP